MAKLFIAFKDKLHYIIRVYQIMFFKYTAHEVKLKFTRHFRIAFTAAVLTSNF